MGDAQEDLSENWNMAKAYYYRIDQILTAITQAHIEGNAQLWYKLLIRLYTEIETKMDKKNELPQAIKLKNELTKLMREQTEQVSTNKFLDLELFLREILNKRNMLTPKTWDKGL